METSVDVAGQLRLAVTRMARRLRREADSALTPSLTAALATVANHGPLTPSELARREGIQRPNATKIIARLEEEGLVAREVDLFDQRSSHISLTPEGAKLLQEMRSRKDAYLAQRLAELPPEDQSTLARAARILEDLL